MRAVAHRLANRLDRSVRHRAAPAWLVRFADATSRIADSEMKAPPDISETLLEVLLDLEGVLQALDRLGQSGAAIHVCRAIDVLKSLTELDRHASDC